MWTSEWLTAYLHASWEVINIRVLKNQHSLLLASDLSDELDSSLGWSRLPQLVIWNEFFVGSAGSRGDNVETIFSVDDESSKCNGICDLRCWFSGLFNTERRNLRVSARNAFKRFWRIRLRRTSIIVRTTMLKRSARKIENSIRNASKIFQKLRSL